MVNTSNQRRSLAAPLVAGGLLLAASCAWTWTAWDNVREREDEQLERQGSALAGSVSLVLGASAGGRDADDEEVERLLAGHIRFRRPVLRARVVRGDHTVAVVENPPRGNEVPPEAVREFTFPVGGPGRPPPNDEPPPPRGRRRPPPPPVDGSGLSVVVACDSRLPSHIYADHVPQIAAVNLVAWAGIAALVIAWYRSIRSRDLARELDAERRERTRLEELNLAAAGLAHETKNPLGIILGLAQRLARDPANTAATREAAEHIMDAADQAAARLGDFMGFARLGNPRMEAVPAGPLLGHVTRMLQPDFDDAGVRLVVKAQPMVLQCAPAMLEQLLVNLLLNSLQASSKGTEVVVQLDANATRARLVVEDQGSGIPADLLPDIFKPYVTGRAAGHGLGLAIVKRIVDQHGWGVDVQSTVGRGTRVTLSDLQVVVAGEKHA